MDKYMKEITIKIPKWLVGTTIHLMIICFLIFGYNLPDWINNKTDNLKILYKFSDIIMMILIMLVIFNLLNYIYEIIKSIVLDNKPIQFYNFNIKLPYKIKKETNVGKYQ